MQKGLGTTDNERKVTRGAPASIPASTWNAVIDAVKTHKRTRWREGQPALGTELFPSKTCLVKNTLAAHSDPFRVYKLGDALLSPEGDGQNLGERFAHEGWEPTTDCAFAVVREPLGADEIGEGVFSGLAVCWVKMNTSTDEWADPVDGESRFLESTDCGGQARILWHGDLDGAPAAGCEIAVVNIIGAKACPATAGATSSWKEPVRVATTTSGTLSSSFENGDVIDGVTISTGDRILIKNQSSASANGIYKVNAAGAPTRTTDADVGSELVGAVVWVSEGVANQDTIWACTTNATITLGTTALAWIQVYPSVVVCEVTAVTSGNHTVKRKKSGGAYAIVDSTGPVTFANCYSTTGGTGVNLPVGTLVTLEPMSDVPGNYWITPVAYAASGKPGLVSDIGQQFSGGKEFLNCTTFSGTDGTLLGESVLVNGITNCGGPAYVNFFGATGLSRFGVVDGLESSGDAAFQVSSSGTYTVFTDRKLGLFYDTFSSFPSGRAGTVYLNGVIKFGAVAAASVPNDCLFKDAADGKLKFKDAGGTSNALY